MKGTVPSSASSLPPPPPLSSVTGHAKEVTNKQWARTRTRPEFHYYGVFQESDTVTTVEVVTGPVGGKGIGIETSRLTQ